MQSLKFGDQGQDVRQLQIVLNSLMKPTPPLTILGRFGPLTEALVKAFQKSRKLEPDGVVGPKTRDALGLKPAEQSKPKKPPTDRSWLDIAAAEISVKEDSRPGFNNNRIVEYHATTSLRATEDETAWCSSFVNWVVIQGGGKGTNSAAAKSWLTWGRELVKPESGCIVVIKKITPGFTKATGSTTGYHVGFYVSSTATHIRILGGNQSDQVKYSNFALASYEPKGYRAA